jgi:hypothetical protein
MGLHVFVARKRREAARKMLVKFTKEECWRKKIIQNTDIELYL